MKILLAILIFSIIVIIHELGHFSLAKANGIQVLEFSLGMGPRILTWVKTKNGIRLFFLKTSNQLEDIEEIKGHTWYSIKIFPFGGSCMMLGEEEAVDSDRAFNKKSVYARMSVIFAGPFFNFILAFLLAIIIVANVGYDPAKIVEVQAGGQMEAAGFQAGDTITKIDGDKIALSREIGTHFQFSPLTSESTTITVERNGESITKELTPQLVKQEDGTERYLLGFTYPSSGNPDDRVKTSAIGTLKYAGYEVNFWIKTTVKTLGSMIRGKVSMNDIAGPVGIVSFVGDTVDQTVEATKEQRTSDQIWAVVLNMINIGILLTANLGVMNLLPIPALDGGRLLFLIVEWIRRKPLNEKIEAGVNFAGFMLLMLLMVVVMFNDIIKLF